MGAPFPGQLGVTGLFARILLWAGAVGGERTAAYIDPPKPVADMTGPVGSQCPDSATGRWASSLAAGFKRAMVEGDTTDATTVTGTVATTTTGTVATTTTESAPDYRVEDFGGAAPAAAGVAIVAQQATDFDVSTWADITQPDVARCAQVVFSASWDGGNVIVDGVAMDGSDKTDTIVAAAGSTVAGAKAFRVIRRVRNSGTRTAGTVDVQTGAKLGVPVGAGVPTIGKVYETTAGGDVTNTSTLSAVGLLTLPSAPNGTLKFLVAYTVAKTYTSTSTPTMASTSTLTGASHTHALSVA